MTVRELSNSADIGGPSVLAAMAVLVRWEGRMMIRRPIRTVRALLRRFADLERAVQQLQGRVTELHHAQVSTGEQIIRAAAAAVAERRELRDAVHLAARRGTLRRTPVRALFLIHHIEAWDAYDEVVALMRRSPDFEPIVMSIPRQFHGSSGLEFEEEVHRGLQQRDVPHLRLPVEQVHDAVRTLQAIDPDLIFRQAQWDADIPDNLITDQLTFSRLCLVPYETMNLVRNVPQWGTENTAVDSPFHRAAWVVFCTNSSMLEEATRAGIRGGAQFRVVGHPKADRLRTASAAWPIAPRAERPRARIVWSAHHTIGEGWSSFGAFHLMSTDMLAWAREAPNVDFVFMPHPALVPFIASPDSPISTEHFADWRAQWEALPNTGYFMGDYPPLLAASDLMLTDGLSMLVEYQVIGKPIVFFERTDHRPFTVIGERVRTGTHPVQSVAAAREKVDRLLRDGDPLRERQAENVEELFGPPGSATRILATLRELIRAERGAEEGMSVSRPLSDGHGSRHGSDRASV